MIFYILGIIRLFLYLNIWLLVFIGGHLKLRTIRISVVITYKWWVFFITGSTLQIASSMVAWWCLAWTALISTELELVIFRAYCPWSTYAHHTRWHMHLYQELIIVSVLYLHSPLWAYPKHPTSSRWSLNCMLDFFFALVLPFWACFLIVVGQSST